MAVYLIEYEICGAPYTGSTKSKFKSRANSQESTQTQFVNREAVPKYTLTQNVFMNITVQIDIF